MGIHLFVLRSWYFLFLAFVGTLHVTIPFAIASYSVLRDGHWFLLTIFLPIATLWIALINVTAMRAVMRSYGTVGEPDTVGYMKSVLRNLTFDTILPFNIAFTLSILIAWVLRQFMGDDPISGVFLPRNDPQVISLLDAVSILPFDALLILNGLVFLGPIHFVVICLFGVTAASGAAMASAKSPMHLPIHGFAQRFWFIAPTILCNASLIAAIFVLGGLGGLIAAVAAEASYLAAGAWVGVALIGVLAYFNVPVAFALAYCDFEDERRAEEEIISEVRRHGLQDEGFDVRALRHSRMAADELPIGE